MNIILNKNNNIVFLVASASLLCSFSLQAEDRSFVFLNSNVERMSSYNHVRYKTFGFNLDNVHVCPSFTSYIVSSVNRFEITTPLYGPMLYASRSETDGSTYVFSEAPTCKYKFTINKFVMSQGEEHNLGHTSQAKIDAIIAQAKHRFAQQSKDTGSETSRSGVASNDFSSVPLPGQIGKRNEIDVTISVRKSDPIRDGISQTGAAFASDDNRLEYTEMLYCAPASCSIFIADADGYKIKDASEPISDRHEIDVIGPDTRLHITLERIITGGSTNDK